jgi:hypothetical protein
MELPLPDGFFAARTNTVLWRAILVGKLLNYCLWGCVSVIHGKKKKKTISFRRSFNACVSWFIYLIENTCDIVYQESKVSIPSGTALVMDSTSAMPNKWLGLCLGSCGIKNSNISIISSLFFPKAPPIA